MRRRNLAMLLVAAVLLLLAAYTGSGWCDAYRDAPRLRAEAVRLRAEGLGPAQLTTRQTVILLAVEDPAFRTHRGVDFSTPGAGATTMTQSLSKHLAFDRFTPGVRKLRQTGYAWGLERSLSKDEILTLYLHRAGFRGADGRWVEGFDAASRRLFGRPVAQLPEPAFKAMVASLIAPALLAPDHRDAALSERVARIERLLQGRCRPSSHGDVWLEGCAGR